MNPTINFNCSKLLSRFHAARPNRSRVTSQSLKLRTRWFKNCRVKTKELVTQASIVPTRRKSHKKN